MRFTTKLILTVAVSLLFHEVNAKSLHIVLIVADDLGWANVGYHGGNVSTPNIDRLAASGAKLEQFYVQPVCSPTRSSLMTGRYPIRQGLQVGVIRPWADYGLPLNERTLATALQEQGYTTAISGKWHLGLHEPDYLPTRRGFELQYGHYCGALDYYTHQRNGGHDWHRNDKAVYDQGYATDLIAAEAVRIIDNHEGHRPLFLYVPFNAPHTPLQAPANYVDRYGGIENRKHRIYAAMVTAMDDAIGRIMDAIERQEMRNNTLIFFCSDNGGPNGTGDNGPLRGWKGTVYEGGIRVVACISLPGRIASGSVVNQPLHIVDIYPTLLGLAGASLEQELPLDGKDAWGAIAEGRPSPHEEILHQLEPKRAALRQGDWKLVVHSLEQSQRNRQRNGNRSRQGSTQQIELFNIAMDPFEKKNVAEQHPEVVGRMQARLVFYRREAVPPKGGEGPMPRDFQVPRVWGEAEVN